MGASGHVASVVRRPRRARMGDMARLPGLLWHAEMAPREWFQIRIMPRSSCPAHVAFDVGLRPSLNASHTIWHVSRGISRRPCIRSSDYSFAAAELWDFVGMRPRTTSSVTCRWTGSPFSLVFVSLE
eukprot:3265094-Pyramimonas_sp.AAC.1